MKKFTTVIAIIVLISFSSGKTSAQDFSVGGGLYYATSLNNIGISLNGNYEINKQIQIAPSFIYFLAKDYVSWKAFDVDGHYKFLSNKGLGVYGIAGLAVTMVSLDFPSGEFFGGNLSVSSTEIGVNLGIGVSKNIGTNLDGFSELKYTLNNGGYLKIGAGVLYRF